MPSKPIRIYDFSQETADAPSLVQASPAQPPSSRSSKTAIAASIDFGTGDEEEEEEADLFAQDEYDKRIVQRYNKPVKTAHRRRHSDDDDDDGDDDGEESEVNSDEELSELFDDEAEEGEEEEEEEEEEEDSLSAGSDVDSALAGPPRPRHAPSYAVTDKKDRKVCKNFSLSLLERAVATGVEEEEVALLAMLIWEELDLTPSKVVDMLARAGCGTGTLLRLADLSTNVHTSNDDPGANRFSPKEILHFLDRSSRVPEVFLHGLNAALEAGMLALSDKETVREIFSHVSPETLGTDTYARRAARALVSNSRSKARCGKALCYFTESLPPAEACDLVHEALLHDDFLDTKGDMMSFYLQFPKGMRDDLVALFKEHEFIGEDGEIRKEEDADEDGNLADFVVDDDVISLMTGASEEEDEDEDEEMDDFIDDDVEEDFGRRDRRKKSKGKKSKGKKRDKRRRDDDSEEEEDEDEEGRGREEKIKNTKNGNPNPLPKAKASTNGDSNGQKRRRIMVLDDEEEEL